MEKLIGIGLLMIMVGFVILFVGIMGSALQERKTEANGETRAGGIILIGPVPIVFGTDKTMIWLSIAGAVILLLACLLWRRG